MKTLLFKILKEGNMDKINLHHFLVKALFILLVIMISFTLATAYTAARAARLQCEPTPTAPAVSPTDTSIPPTAAAPTSTAEVPTPTQKPVLPTATQLVPTSQPTPTVTPLHKKEPSDPTPTFGMTHQTQTPACDLCQVEEERNRILSRLVDIIEKYVLYVTKD